MPVITRRTRNGQPRNNSSVNIARSSIDQITPLAVRQQQNALAVDGRPVVYYKRKISGLRCTCCGSKPEQPPVEISQDVQVLQSDGKGTQDYLHSLVAGTAFSIDRYGSRPRTTDANGVSNTTGKRLPNSHVAKTNKLHSTDLEDPFADIIDDEPITKDDLFGDSDPVENTTALGTNTTGCAVCLGTGYVGGYDPLNAVRIVLDVQNSSWSGDINQVATVMPHHFAVLHSFDGSAPTATVRLTLPKGVAAVDCIRLWNNRDLVTDVRFFIRDNSNLVNVGNNLTQYCDGQEHELTLEFDPNSESSFTHLEIQLDIGSDPIYAEWAKTSWSENLQTYDNMDSPSVVISPTVPAVLLKDIVVESVTNRAWVVTQSSGGMDREKRVQGWEATLRVVQKYELQSLLPIRRTRTYYSGNRVVPQHQDRPEEHVFDPYPDTQQTRLR